MKKITVDQSKVLKNWLFRFFWATRYKTLSLPLAYRSIILSKWGSWKLDTVSVNHNFTVFVCVLTIPSTLGGGGGGSLFFFCKLAPNCMYWGRGTWAPVSYIGQNILTKKKGLAGIFAQICLTFAQILPEFTWISSKYRSNFARIRYIGKIGGRHNSPPPPPVSYAYAEKEEKLIHREIR